MSQTIAKEYRRFSSMVIVSTAVLVGTMWAFFSYQHLEQESTKMEQMMMASSRDILQERVRRVVSFIEYRRGMTEKRLKNEVREYTIMACAAASGLVNRYKDRMGREDLENLVRDSLRDIRYNNGRGYFFAINEDGTEELFAVRPELEGTSLIDMMDTGGQYVVRDMLALARKYGEGYYQYTWSKPGSPGGDHLKISFIKQVPELNWVIGTGEYFDDVTRDVQRDVLNRLEQERLGPEGSSYFFTGNFDGVTLSGPAVGRNNLGIQDANGVFVVKELIRLAKNGGGFLEYIMPDVNGMRSARKLSYVSSIPKWDWYVGTGTYLDEIELVQADLRDEYKQTLQKYFLYIGCATIVVLVLNLQVARLYGNRLQNQTARVVEFFRDAADEPIILDDSLFKHQDFQEIGRAANKMLAGRNAAFREAREARDYWSRTFGAIRDAVMIFDKDGICVQSNEAGKELFRQNNSDITGKYYGDFLCEENLVELCRRDLKIHHGLISTLNHGRIFSASCYPVIRDDTLDSIIYTLTDVTEQKRLEDELAQSQRLESVGRLAGGVAHDFNNILSAIIGNVELLQLKMEPDNPLQEYLRVVKQSGQRAARLTRQLLAFSRREIIQPEILSLALEVRELNRMIGQLLGENIEIVINCAADLWPVEMDRGQFEQLLVNLAVNARDAMKAGGTLSIELSNVSLVDGESGDVLDVGPGDFVMLAVSDTGTGMEPDVVEKVFEPFYTTKNRSEGTGLGLSTVHGIVKQNRGEILVDSEIGRGTTFKVFLRRCLKKKIAERATTDAGSIIPGGTETILMVEDDADVRNMLVGYLGNLGYTILEAGNGEEALQVFAAYHEKIDMLLTDVIMPRMGGPELAGILTDDHPELIVLYMSGYTDEAIVDHGVLEEGINFLHKPISPPLLAATMHKLLL